MLGLAGRRLAAGLLGCWDWVVASKQASKQATRTGWWSNVKVSSDEEGYNCSVRSIDDDVGRSVGDKGEREGLRDERMARGG